MICFPLTHKQTIKKVIRLAYKKNTKYGVMAELLFVTGYRICDVIDLRKRQISNNFNASMFFPEKKTGTRRMFQECDLPTNFIEYISKFNASDYIFPSNRAGKDGKLKHISASRVKQVFSEIFGSIYKLEGAISKNILINYLEFSDSLFIFK